MSGFMGGIKYDGVEKIVVAMDIGTTHSAVSYAYLYPDDHARARIVTKWPGQPDSSGSSKIPTLVAYHGGEAKAYGPEAYELLDDETCEIARWFKLHLHPPAMRISNATPTNGTATGFEILPLPEGKTIEDIYADFMRYLIENTHTAFMNSVPTGAAIWDRLRDSMVIILTTPNGWDLVQQGVLRRAAISANLVSSSNAQALLEFVTEGEASVHYALAYTQSKAWLAEDCAFVVIDAGGSTVDSTLYKCKETSPRVLLEEVRPSACVQTGGLFIDRAAQSMFQRKVQGSLFASEEWVKQMVAAFEGNVKRAFDGSQTSNKVAFGSIGDDDPYHYITGGKIYLTLEEVRGVFEGVVERVQRSVLGLLDGQIVKFAILVGGLGESPYLRMKLTETLGQHGTAVVTAEEPAKKAAAEGAVIWFVKQTVTSRIARNTFGVATWIDFSAIDPEHQQRISLKTQDPNGSDVIPGKFITFVAKGFRVPSDFKHRENLHQFYEITDTDRKNNEQEILVWEGDEIPRWTTKADGTRLRQFRVLCTIRADLSRLRASMKLRRGPKGRYCRVDFAIILQFGGTQLQATMEWEDRGIKREGPVTIIPNALF